MMRRILHRFFELGIIFKAIDGGLELVGGLLLIFLSPAAINRVVFFFLEGELKEDPTDLVANLLLHTTRSAIEVRVPASVFLIAHGIVKLVLVGGLATNRLWSYPAAPPRVCRVHYISALSTQPAIFHVPRGRHDPGRSCRPISHCGIQTHEDPPDT
jgi:uncharacterized membrane protein